MSKSRSAVTKPDSLETEPLLGTEAEPNLEHSGARKCSEKGKLCDKDPGGDGSSSQCPELEQLEQHSVPAPGAAPTDGHPTSARRYLRPACGVGAHNGTQLPRSLVVPCQAAHRAQEQGRPCSASRPVVLRRSVTSRAWAPASHRAHGDVLSARQSQPVGGASAVPGDSQPQKRKEAFIPRSQVGHLHPPGTTALIALAAISAVAQLQGPSWEVTGDRKRTTVLHPL